MIHLFGSTGYTGRRVLRDLALRNIPLKTYGRSTNSLNSQREEFQNIVSSSVIDTRSFPFPGLILAPEDVIINCIGPYNVYFGDLIEFLYESGVKYIDVCGEQQFVLDSLEHSQQRGQHQSSVFHSVAFESSLALLLADVYLKRDQDYQEITSFYKTDSLKISPGTKNTMKSSKYFHHRIWDHGKLVSEEPYEFEYPGKMPEHFQEYAGLFFPLPDSIFFVHDFKVQNSLSCSLVPKALKDSFKSIKSESLSKKAHAGFYPELQSETSTAPDRLLKAHFQIGVSFKESSGREGLAVVEGHSAYEITSWLVSRLATSPEFKEWKPHGFSSLIDVLDSKKILDELSQLGFVTSHYAL